MRIINLNLISGNWEMNCVFDEVLVKIDCKYRRSAGYFFCWDSKEIV